jgi:YD repeat-containing protein
MLYYRVLATLAFCLLASAASAQLTARWWTATGAGTGSYHGSPQEACVAQHAAFAADSPGPISARPQTFTAYSCDWVTHLEGGPINPLPTTVYLRCLKPDGTEASSVGVNKVPPGVCIPKLQQTYSRTACRYQMNQGANPLLGNPVLVRDGSKYHRVEDFSTSDGLLSVTRTYRSLTGAHALYPGLGALGYGWRFGYDWALLVSGNFSTDGDLSVVAPDGSIYGFEFPSSGGVIAPTLDLSLTFNNTYGPSVTRSQVFNGGGTFTARTVSNEVIEFTLYQPAGSSKYQAAERTQVRFPGGYEWNFTYGTKHELLQIEDSFGRSLNFSWSMLVPPGNPGGAYPSGVASIALPDGTSLRYTLDNQNGSQAAHLPRERLLRAERLDPNDVVTWSEQYHYEDPDLILALTGITDASGVRYGTYAYDDFARVVSSSHAGGADQTTIAYTDSADKNFAIRTVTNALGKQTVYRFRRASTSFGGEYKLTDVTGQPSPNCVGTVRTITYYSGHRPQDETDEEGRVTRYTYHSDGRVQNITRAFGTAEAVTTTYTWHPSFPLPTRIQEPRLTTDLTYDPTGALTGVTQTDTTTHVLPYPTNGQTRSWSFTYSGPGLLQTVDGPLPGTGDLVSFGYDAAGYLSSVEDELGHVTTVSAVNGRGQPTSITDPNGKAYTLGYDGVGRLTSVSENLGAVNRVTSVTYDEIGQVDRITLPDGSFLDYGYDDARRLRLVTNNAGERLEYNYDLLGNITSRTVKDGAGAIVETQAQTFDELGRLLSSIGASSQTWTLSYDKVGNVVAVEDPRENVFGYGYNRLNDLIRLTDEASAATDLTRNAAGDVATIRDPNTITTAYVRNGWGETIQEQSPDIGTMDYVRNALGLVTQKTDGRGVVSQYSYDDAGRLTAIVYPGSPSENVTLTYDSTAGGNAGRGRLTSVADAAGSASFVYDLTDELRAAAYTIGGEAYNVAYDYDAAGRLSEIVYPSGRVVSYSYDAAGRLAMIETKENAAASAVKLAEVMAARPFEERLAAVERESGLVDWHSFDGDGRVQAYGVRDGTTQLFHRLLDYGDGINLTDVLDQLDPSHDEAYGYSPTNRLQETGGPWGELDALTDGVGNRTLLTRTVGGVPETDAYSRAAGTNRISLIATDGAPTRSFTYDDAGNILSDLNDGVTTAYTYNHAGQLETVTVQGSERGLYVYNALGQLASRTVLACWRNRLCMTCRL